MIADEDGEIDEDKLMECALEAGAADFQAEDGIFEIYTEPDDLTAVREALEGAGYELTEAEVAEVPNTYTVLKTEEEQKFMDLLLTKLEEDDDVQSVYHNWENED